MRRKDAPTNDPWDEWGHLTKDVRPKAAEACAGRDGAVGVAVRGARSVAPSTLVACSLSTRGESLRAAIARNRGALDAIMGRYAATNPRLFGSVARGDATPDSDIDLLVDLLPGAGNELLRVSGIAEELTGVLGARVDVVATSLLRGEVSSSALADAVAV
jgi:predicted nucleotidyltransferase